MALQPAAQTAMYNKRRQNRATGTGGSTTVAPVRPTEGAIGSGKSYYDFNGIKPGSYWSGSPPPAPSGGGGGGGGGGPTPVSPPGYGENWYAANAYKYNHESAANQYWNGVQGQFNNPTTHETNLGNYADQLGHTKSAIENLYDQYNGSGEFTKPTAGEQWYAQNGSQYNAPSHGEQTLAGVQGQLGQTGDMENFYRQNAGTLLNNNNLAQHSAGIANDIGSARKTGQFYDATSGDLLAPSYTEGLANGYQPGPSYNEQFLLGGGATQGLDQLYDRLYSQGSRRLGNEGAARGSFNSGASMRAAEELNSDLGAQHVKDYMAASQAADTSRLADQNYGLNLMQGADTSLRGRVSVGLTGAQMADSSALNRAKAGQDLYTGVSNETRSNIDTAGGLADKSNSQWLQRLRDTAGAGNMEATQFLNRLNSGSEAAGRATDDWQKRMNTGRDFAQGDSDAWANRLKDAGGMEKTQNDMMMDRFTTGGNLAGGADAGYWNALAQGQTAANSAQNMQENRESNTYRNLSDLGGKQATTYGNGVNQANDEQRDALMSEINGLIAKGGVTSQMIMNKYGAMMQSLGLIIQGGRVIQGNMNGANPGFTGGGAPKTSGVATPPPSPYGTSQPGPTEDELFPY